MKLLLTKNRWLYIDQARSGQSALNENMTKYFRPWKLFTLAIGITLLTSGSFYYSTPDWDIPVSFLMAILAYFAARQGTEKDENQRGRTNK